MTALNSEGLLPCPFCGNDGTGPIEDSLQIYHSEPDWVQESRHTWSVQCDKCTATMGYSDSEEEAIAAWNRRALPPVDGLEVVAWVDAGTIDLSWEKKIVATNPEYVQRNGGLGQFQPLVTLSQASSVIAGLRAERDHWKANHDQTVQRNSVLRERPDLPVDRLPAISRYEARISSLEEENRRLREANEALMRERTSIIATHRESIDRLTLKIGVLEAKAEHAARQALEDHNG